MMNEEERLGETEEEKRQTGDGESSRSGMTCFLALIWRFFTNKWLVGNNRLHSTATIILKVSGRVRTAGSMD